MKTRKSIVKRFKITKTGKILYRPVGQNHFRAKKSGKIKRIKRKWVNLDKSMAKKVKQMLLYKPHSKKKSS